MRLMLTYLLALTSCSEGANPRNASTGVYDKLCEARLGLFSNALAEAEANRRAGHPRGMAEPADPIDGLPRQEQRAARAACEDWGRRLLQSPSGLQVCEQGEQNCVPAG
jgi:hypothetical protein